MIEVKLHFPDQAALIAFFSGAKTLPAQAVDVTKTATENSATVTPDKQAAASASTKKTDTVAETAKPIAEAVAAATKAVPTVDYPTLQKEVFELVKQVKSLDLDPAEHVLGIAKSFGYENFAAMKVDGPTGALQYAPALDAVRAKAKELAELATA